MPRGGLALLLLLAGCSRDGLLLPTFALASEDLGPPPVDLSLADLATPPTCVGGGGMQADAPWPVFGGCASQQRRSRYRGPRSARLAWRFQGGERGIWATPAIGSDGTVYVGSFDGNLYALDGQSGALKWKVTTGNEIPSSPVIDADGTLIFGSWDGKVYAVDGQSGAVRWTHETGVPLAMSPTVTPDGVVLAISTDGVLLGLDRHNGIRRWVTTIDCYAYSLAVEPNGTAYMTGSYQVAAVEGATGRIKWTQRLDNAAIGPPVLGDDGSLYVSSPTGLQALDRTDGSTRMAIPVEGSLGLASTPAIGADGTIYGWYWDNTLRAIDPHSGHSRWQFRSGDGVQSALAGSPAVDAGDTVYLGTVDGNFYAFDGRTGTLLFTFPTGGRIGGSAAIGANGMVYFGSQDGALYALGP